MLQPRDDLVLLWTSFSGPGTSPLKQKLMLDLELALCLAGQKSDISGLKQYKRHQKLDFDCQTLPLVYFQHHAQQESI